MQNFLVFRFKFNIIIPSYLISYMIELKMIKTSLLFNQGYQILP